MKIAKTNLDRLLARRPESIFVNPFECGEIGPDLFCAACDNRVAPKKPRLLDRRTTIARLLDHYPERGHTTLNMVRFAEIGARRGE